MAFTPKNYSQGQSPWGPWKLTPSPLTMKAQGCVTVLAARIASNVLGRDVTPGEMNQYATRTGGYTTGGLFLWRCLETFTKGKAKFLGSYYDKNARYILRVVYIGLYRHFVAIKGATQCFDPLDGKVKNYPKTWKLTNEYRSFR